MWIALGLAWQLGYVIVIPLVVFGLIGRFLDKKYETAPLLFFMGIILSLIVTSIWMIKNLKQFMEKQTKDDNKKV